eukprot:514341_1
MFERLKTSLPMNMMSDTILFILTAFVWKTDSYLPSSQISALNDLYESLNGDNWTVCQWDLTELALNSTLPSYYCGLYIDAVSINTHTVYAITVSYDNNLNGTITDSIDKLVDLEIISIQNNELLTGNIPETVCNLAYLWKIDFVIASLSGNIPKCIGTMSSIQFIQFLYIPLLSMTDDIIKSLCKHSKNIYAISLRSINFTGSIPECIGSELSELQSLQLFDLPNLNSTIPQSFNNLTKMTFLRLQKLPHLHGSFPSGILKKNNFYFFQVYQMTALSGTISMNDLCEFSTDLTSLAIGYNPLLYPLSIPTNINKLKNLQIFALGGSSIYGTIPKEFCALNNLVMISIQNTSITGYIPKCFEHLTKLIYFNVYSNNLNGEFPTMSSTKLKLIDIHNNSFTG